MRSGNKEMQRGKSQQSVFESEHTLQINRHISLGVLFRLLGFPLAAQTQRIELLLHLLVCKMCVEHMKGASQLQPVGHSRIAGSKAQLRLHLHWPEDYRRIGSHSQPKQVFNPRSIQDDVEFYIVPFRGAHADHGSIRCERRMQECCFYRLEICVSSGAVNDGMKLRMQVDR